MSHTKMNEIFNVISLFKSTLPQLILYFQLEVV